MRLLRDTLFYTLVFFFILLEEIWSEIYETIKSLHLVARFHTWLNTFLEDKSRYVVLAIFFIFAAVMEMFALMSTRSFVTGHFTLGVLFYVIKGLITLPTIELFQNQKPKLLTFGWINWIYKIVLQIQASRYFRNIMVLFKRVKRASAVRWRLFKRRFRGERSRVSRMMAALYRKMKRDAKDEHR